MLTTVLLSLLLAQSVPTADFSSTTRIGTQTSETILTPTSVVTGFGKKGSYGVDGAVYAQPLYTRGVTISGTVYDLLIVATMHDTVYAFDANRPGSAALWSVSTGTSWTTGFPVTNPFYGGEVGCVATPTIDETNGVVYVLCAVQTPLWKLWKINLSTHATSSVTVTATVSGSGAGSSGGNLTFDPSHQICRPGITLANSLIYIACGSENDASPWHGWVMSYNSSLVQQAVWCSTPDGDGGGIWMSGGGPVVDSNGNLYVVTGNGDYDGITNFGQSAVKLNSALVKQDWYTPTDWSASNALDRDIGSGRPMLIPSTNLLVFSSKDLKAYAVDITCMGHLGGTVGGCSPQILTTFAFPAGTWNAGSYGDMFLNGSLYITTVLRNHNTEDTVSKPLYKFDLTGSTFGSGTASSLTGDAPGLIVSGSINVNTNGVLWAMKVATDAVVAPKAAILLALNPSDMSIYWQSDTLSRDAVGNLAKFALPTIANGNVYVATLDNTVVMYGLLPSSQEGGLTTTKGVVNKR